MWSHKIGFMGVSVFYLSFTADSQAPSPSKLSQLPLSHGGTVVAEGQGWLTAGKCSDTHPRVRQMAGLLGSPKHDAWPSCTWRCLRWRLPMAIRKSDSIDKQMPEIVPWNCLCITTDTVIGVWFGLHMKILGQSEDWGFQCYCQDYYSWKTRT